jgi:glucose/arabinose dehydrogenase
MLVQAGKNHGFSNSNTCGSQVPGSVPPMYKWGQTIGATGIAFTCNSLFPDLSNRIILGNTNLGALMEIRLAPDHSYVQSVDALYDVPDGTFIIDVETAPDGSIYFTTQTGIYRIRNINAPQPAVKKPAGIFDLPIFQVFIPEVQSPPITC